MNGTILPCSQLTAGTASLVPRFGTTRDRHGKRAAIRLTRALCSAFLAAAAALMAPLALDAQALSFAGAQTTIPVSGLIEPFGVAVDSKGDIFVADSQNNIVVEVSAGGFQTTVASGLRIPAGVAVDRNGDLFIADTRNNRVLEVPADGGAQMSLGSGLDGPYGVAVDGNGNVFIADTFNNRVVEVLAGGSQITLATGLNEPTGVAVDGNGSVFIADTLNHRVLELPAGGGAQSTVGNGLFSPLAVAVDAAGDVFIADNGNSRVVEVPAGGGAQTTVGSAILAPYGVAVDGKGDVFMVDDANARVFKVQTVSVNFGNINLGSSAVLTLKYNITAGGTIGAVNVLTQGTPNLDFTLAGSSTCAGSVTAGSTCTVNVNFAPRAAGLRLGAVQVADTSGHVLATTLVYGQGQGPTIAFDPGVQTTVGSGLGLPGAMAVDAAGNVFITDLLGGSVVKVPAGGGSQTTVGTGLLWPSGVAVDGAGNVFIADTNNSRVVKIPAGGGAKTTVGSGLDHPKGVALDGAGNIFIADTNNNRVVKNPAAGGTQTTIASGLNYPDAVAVDGAGNVFIADTDNGRVVKIAAGDGAQTTVGSGVFQPTGVAVDAAGDVFIADLGGDQLLEVLAGGGAQATVPRGDFAVNSVAVDGAGNIFFTDFRSLSAVEVHRSQPPALSFATTALGVTSSDSPKSVTIENIGNQPLLAVAPGLVISGANSASFRQVAASGTPADCTSGFSLTPGTSCNLSISFSPVLGGENTAVVALTNNSLNRNPATQSIPLSGVGTVPLAAVSPASISFGTQPQGTTSGTQSVTLTNSGTADLSVSSIGISTNFAQTSNCGSTVAANSGSCTINITFTPQSTGPITGTLTITDNSGGTDGSTQTVSLSGTGTNFTIAASPASQTIPIAKTATFTVTLAPVSGFTGNVSLACSGGPASSTCSISPSSLTLNGTTSVKATVSISFARNSDTKGTFPFTLTGTSGRLSQQTQVSVTVKE